MSVLTDATSSVRKFVDLDVRRAVRVPVVRYRHLGLTPDDVVFAAYPKSGSTWVRFLLAGALTGEEMHWDIIRSISPPLGRHRKAPAIIRGKGHLAKTHDRPGFLPGTPRPRVIWLVRDGRDVMVSRFHHIRSHGVDWDYDTYFNRQLSGNIIYGSWQKHARTWLDYVNSSPTPATYIRYEDLLADPVETLLTASDKVDLGLKRDKVEAAVEANTPSRMRAKEAGSAVLAANRTAEGATPFVRAAKSGSWRDELTGEYLKRFEAAAGRELTELGYPLSTDTHSGDR